MSLSDTIVVDRNTGKIKAAILKRLYLRILFGCLDVYRTIPHMAPHSTKISITRNIMSVRTVFLPI